MRATRRAALIQRFENRERARQQMRFFELCSLAGIYANERCCGDIDAGYHEIVKALDDIGFLGARVLYLDPDIRPPYFPQPRKLEKEKLKWLPHKTNPIITRQFIEAREKELGWPLVRDAYLAKGWTYSLPAARWLESKGITPPSSIAWSLKAREEKKATPNRKGRKPGRKPKFDWDDAKAFARQEWDMRGPFKNFETGWKANADLERLVMDYMSRHDEAGEPSDSSLKEHVSKWVLEFEAEN